MRKFIYPLLISAIFISSGCKSGSSSGSTTPQQSDVEDVPTNSGNLTPVNYTSHIFNVYSGGYTGIRNILGPFAISHDGKYAYLPYVVENTNGTRQIGAFYYSIDANGRLIGVGGNTYLPTYDQGFDTAAYIVTNPHYNNYIIFSPANGAYFGCINSDGSLAQGVAINPYTNAYGVLYGNSGSGFWAIEASNSGTFGLGVNYYKNAQSCASMPSQASSTFQAGVMSSSSFNQEFVTNNKNFIRRMAEFTNLQFYVANGNSQIVSYNSQFTGNNNIINQYTYTGYIPYNGESLSNIIITPNHQYAFLLDTAHDAIDMVFTHRSNGDLANQAQYKMKNHITDFIMSPDGNHVYTLSVESANPSKAILSSFQINYLPGGLNHIADKTFTLNIPNDSLRGLSITPDGRHIYIASKLGEIFEFYVGIEGDEYSTNFAKATGSNPSVMEFSANGKYVYVTNFNDGTISQFGYNAGILTTLPKLSGNGANPAGITIDGDNVYIANSSSNTISLYTGGNEGALVHISEIPSITNVNGVKIKTIAGIKYAFVSAYGGAMAIYTVGMDGSLTSNNIQFDPIQNMFSMAFDFLYDGKTNYDNVSIDFINNLIYSGIFAPGFNSFFVAKGAATGTGPVAMAIDKHCHDNRLCTSVYVANLYSNSVSQFSFSPNSGLAPLAETTAATGGYPRDIVVSPDGKNAYVVNFTGSISQYSVSKRDGHLVPLITPSVNAIPNPTAIKISPDGNYALVLSRSNNKLRVYEINK